MEAVEDGRQRSAPAADPVDAELRAAAADAELRAAATDAELRSAAADAQASGDADAGQPCRPPCCPLYHEAIELIGRRWTGAIVSVLIHRTTLRFGEIADSVPELSDRLLSERMKELEPAVRELEAWARRWLSQR